MRYKHYACFLGPQTRLDMMYMPDAVRAIIELMEADAARLRYRNAHNVTVSFTPAELADAIREHPPAFIIAYRVDPVRRSIADCWSRSLDDGAARQDWGWLPRFDLTAMTADMLARAMEKGRQPQDA